MTNPALASLNDRCEQQIIQELSCDPVLRALFPRKQNSSGKPKMPRIAVVAVVGKEVSPGAQIHTVSVSVEFYFDSSKDQTGATLDDAVKRCDDQIGIAQARGIYGVIRDGEQGTQFDSDTIRKRIYALRLMAA